MPGRDPPDNDPLDAVLRPPIDETLEEKSFRLAAEAEAHRISQEIDESIRQEKLQKKKMRVVRLLLLGQSESGKSTTLRQFQRLYTPSAFREERILWHAIIQLNLLRSVHIILDALADGRGCGPGVGGGRELAEEAQALLVACRADLMALWRDNTARTVLKRRKIRLEESPGFFLDDLDRVTQPHYQPSDDDVLKARLKTVGVSEYRFEMEAGSEQGTQWRIIDVGGSRSQCWHYADGERVGDRKKHGSRSSMMEDSVLLWKAVCANKLLARVNLVLFLNKCDILAAKLASGVRLAKYVRSFGERANDSETAEKYFRSKFNAIHREYSPIPRKFYGFCTSVTDTKTTGGIIASGTLSTIQRQTPDRVWWQNMMAPVYMSTPLPRTLDSCLAWAVRFGHQQHQRANVSPLVMLPLKGLHVGANAEDALRFVSLSLQIYATVCHHRAR
ncbi:candidate G-protein alpha subunit [Postia placenta Mad-698-R]|nr:candidate G-protein alpha subunit [Postia placenta Mad-698-R]